MSNILRDVLNDPPVRVVGLVPSDQAHPGSRGARRRAERGARSVASGSVGGVQPVHAAKLAETGRSAANLAHELNNALALVSGNAQHLHAAFAGRPLDRVSPQDWKDMTAGLRSLFDQSERCRRFVSNLLLLARRPRDAGDPSVPVRLNLVIEEVLDACAPALAGEGILVSKLLDPGSPIVNADPEHLHQVFLNLINNARAAMPGGGNLVIETASEDGRVTASVRDSGIGIGRRLLPRLFEPFFTTKPVGKGTGLGLSIVRSIVTRLGGTIEVESDPGEGAVFRVRFPPPRSAEFERQPSYVGRAAR